MSIRPLQNISYNIPPQANSTEEKTQNANSKKTTTAVTTGAIATAGIAAAIISRGKAGKKIADAISEKLPELETKVKGLWGRITGSTKKEEAERIAREQAEAAQKRAAEHQKRLDELRKEAEEARKKEFEELQRQREMRRAEEAAQKAKAEQAALAAKKAKEANSSFKYNSEKELEPFINPKGEVKRNLPKIENEAFDSYYARLQKEQAKIDVYAFARRIKETEPDEIFSKVAEQLEICHKNGGTVSVEDVIKILEESKTTMALTVSDMKQINQSMSYDIEHRFKDYKKYIDELIAEIKTTKTSNEDAPTTVKKAITNIKTKKTELANARKAAFENATRSYQEQLAPIKARIQYDENFVPNPSCNLTPQERQATAAELNKIIKSGGSESNLPPDASIERLQAAWKNKYLSMPISLENQKGETAILNSFPRYEAGLMKNPRGQVYHTLNTGDFKYEPVYRQIHVDNPEEFVRQFENIGGIYAPGRRQSCAKTRYYGECWGPLGGTEYGFAEWSPTYNVKFVIHPKGAISNAADIGEGKYGDLEVLYSADSRFRILGTAKKTVTPEEIKMHISDFQKNFPDFEKYEIHLQEI